MEKTILSANNILNTKPQMSINCNTSNNINKPTNYPTINVSSPSRAIAQNVLGGVPSPSNLSPNNINNSPINKVNNNINSPLANPSSPLCNIGQVAMNSNSPANFKIKTSLHLTDEDKVEDICKNVKLTVCLPSTEQVLFI